MRQLVLSEPGLILDERDTTLDEPGPGQVQIAVTAVGLNPIDAKLAQQGHPEWQYPHVPGVDGVGIIERIGPDVHHVVCGQRVAWHGDIIRDGALSEKVNVAASILIPVPSDIADLASAALPCAGMTAWEAIDRMHLSPSRTVLIEAGAGGVGYYAIQLAKRAGATVITTASEAHHTMLRDAGADRIIDYKTQDIADIVHREIGKVDVVFAGVNGDVSRRDMALIKRGGQFVSLLGLPDFGDLDLFTLSPTIHIIGLGGAHRAEESREELANVGARLMTLVSEGELQTPPIRRVRFSPTDVSRALERELSGNQPGKQVVEL